MITLAPVDFLKIQHWFQDYQKKSKNYEMPPDTSELVGIYKAEELVGYFILLYTLPGVIEINQGYLKKEARHKNLSRISMQELEKLAKEKGFKQIILGTNRAAGSYIRFMRNCGYTIQRAIFAKGI